MTPIAEWSNDQVWEYLYTHNPPPWGGTHDFMLDLYRQASGGECPVVLDLNTPSCGGSRFGCWTCTVVKEDKSMQGFIATGETWMQPLNQFRDWLKAVREDLGKRQGIKRSGAIGPGPFNSETRKEIMRRLLALEQKVGRRLIQDAEISYIQQQWTDSSCQPIPTKKEPEAAAIRPSSTWSRGAGGTVSRHSGLSIATPS